MDTGFNITGKQIALGLVSAAVKANQFNQLCDDDHVHSPIAAFAMSPELTKAVVDGGGKHYLIELPTKPVQEFITLIQSGKLSPAEEQELRNQIMPEYFRRHTQEESLALGNQFVDFVKDCKAKGLQLHARNEIGNASAAVFWSDSMPAIAPDIADPTLGDMSRTAGDIVKKMQALNTPETSQCMLLHREYYADLATKAAAYAHMLGNEVKISAVREQMQKDFNEERSSAYDEKMAQEIKAVFGNERGAIFYGAAHGNELNGKNGRDLDEYLGPSVSKFLLSASPESVVQRIQSGAYSELPTTTLVIGSKDDVQVLQVDGAKAGDEIELGGKFNMNYVRTQDNLPKVKGEAAAGAAK